MPITFNCTKCYKEVTAPDAAAGKKGKCPFCGQPNDIPLPEPREDDDLIPLAPMDEQEERRAAEELRRLREQERELLGELVGDETNVPLEHRDDLTSEDLHHFVVNYCIDMAEGRLPRAEQQVQNLRKYRPLAVDAVNDFLGGEVKEDSLRSIPAPVIQAFLNQLKDKVE
jgi:hypothetical protein